ncbi:MAG: AAA family ATPase [Desulfovibrionaceae bacterium]|nr:AAA family ATPase [Desulfovibrionaceae bacterium]
MLLGLRRTGKTFLLYQWLNSFPRDKTACITVSDNEQFSRVLSDLDLLLENGFKYVALDEITLCPGFISGAACLSDKYASFGMKIFMTGTDSLSLSIAKNHALFDRDITLHTSHIPYAEWSRLLKKESLDDYLHWGGLLSLEPTDGETENSVPMPWTENGRRTYFSSAISENIQNTLRNYADCDSSSELSLLVTKEKQTFGGIVYSEFSQTCGNDFFHALHILSEQPSSLFQAILQSSLNDDNHSLSHNVLAKKFKPSDISRTKSNLGRIDPALADELQEIIQAILPKVEETLHVQNRNAFSIGIDTLYSIEMYLKQLDVYDIYPARYLPPVDPSEKERLVYEKKNRDCRDTNLVCHPGLRYGQTDILRSILEEEMSIRQVETMQQSLILSIYDSTVLGIMLEETVLHELMLACRKVSGLSPENKDWNENMGMPVRAMKLKTLARNPGDPDKEIDIDLQDRRSLPARHYLFGVKHSARPDPVQRRWLLDEDCMQRLCRGVDQVAATVVIYMGKALTTEDGITYCNAEQFLNMLHNDGLDHVLRHVANTSVAL